MPPSVRTKYDFEPEKLEPQRSVISRLCDHLEELGLSSSLDQAKRILTRFSDGRSVRAEEYAEMLSALLDRLIDDTARQEFFMIPSYKVSYYRDAAEIFGNRVTSAFPSAQADIDHAATCYAFGGHTAAVFHLMRVMETGLRVLGKSLNDPTLDPRRNPNWEAILKRCDEQLKLPPKQRTLEWRMQDQFYSEATANLRAVKNAWRNPTMHVEREYDEGEALSVLLAVKGFMQHLATKLHE